MSEVKPIFKRYVVVDIDGTLSDSSAREHLAANKQWDEFHAAAKDDKPNEAVLEAVHAFEGAGFEVIACTGRPEKYRPMTYRWLEEHEIEINTVLMRPNDNYDSDTAIKPQLLWKHLHEAFGVNTGVVRQSVLVVLEDRDKMVETWRGLGLNCWQVKHGGY